MKLSSTVGTTFAMMAALLCSGGLLFAGPFITPYLPLPSLLFYVFAALVPMFTASLLVRRSEDRPRPDR
jgi:hypothetical protein